MRRQITVAGSLVNASHASIESFVTRSSQSTRVKDHLAGVRGDWNVRNMATGDCDTFVFVKSDARKKKIPEFSDSWDGEVGDDLERLILVIDNGDCSKTMPNFRAGAEVWQL